MEGKETKELAVGVAALVEAYFKLQPTSVEDLYLKLKADTVLLAEVDAALIGSSQIMAEVPNMGVKDWLDVALAVAQKVSSAIVKGILSLVKK